MIEKEKLFVDTAIAAPAITLPWWLHAFEEVMQLAIVSVTLVVVLIRAHLAWKDWKSR